MPAVCGKRAGARQGNMHASLPCQYRSIIAKQLAAPPAFVGRHARLPFPIFISPSGISQFTSIVFSRSRRGIIVLSLVISLCARASCEIDHRPTCRLPAAASCCKCTRRMLVLIICNHYFNALSVCYTYSYIY